MPVGEATADAGSSSTDIPDSKVAAEAKTEAGRAEVPITTHTGEHCDNYCLKKKKSFEIQLKINMKKSRNQKLSGILSKSRNNLNKNIRNE
jgi:hypothetical protein